MVNIVVVGVQRFLVLTGAGVEAYQAVVQGRSGQMVGLLQAGEHLLEVVDSLFVAVSLLEPARAEENSVAFEAGVVTGIGNRLTPLQPRA